MSFFCGPMRLRNKKRRGSGDGESLLQDPDSLGPTVDPASPMRVRHDFTACLRDELSICKGQSVAVLDVDRKWAYVAGPGHNGGRGFVPLSCLEPSPPQPESKSNDRPATAERLQRRPAGAETAFPRAELGRYVVLYAFAAGDENDLAVGAGERVAAANEDDPDWTWVRREDGAEGFVPRAYLGADDGGRGTAAAGEEEESSGSGSAWRLHKLQLCGTELMSLYDYQGRIADDLTVARGDLLYADMSNQTHDEWLWAYCPRTQTCGFIPKGYARPPALE